MRIENLEEADNLRKERNRIMKVLEEYQSNKPIVRLVFDTKKPLDIFSQVDVENTSAIGDLIHNQLSRVNNRLKELGVEF